MPSIIRASYCKSVQTLWKQDSKCQYRHKQKIKIPLFVYFFHISPRQPANIQPSLKSCGITSATPVHSSLERPQLVFTSRKIRTGISWYLHVCVCRPEWTRWNPLFVASAHQSVPVRQLCVWGWKSPPPPHTHFRFTVLSNTLEWCKHIKSWWWLYFF